MEKLVSIKTRNSCQQATRTLTQESNTNTIVMANTTHSRYKSANTKRTHHPSDTDEQRGGEVLPAERLDPVEPPPPPKKSSRLHSTQTIAIYLQCGESTSNSQSVKSTADDTNEASPPRVHTQSGASSQSANIPSRRIALSPTQRYTYVPCLHCAILRVADKTQTLALLPFRCRLLGCKISLSSCHGIDQWRSASDGTHYTDGGPGTVSGARLTCMCDVRAWRNGENRVICVWHGHRVVRFLRDVW